MDVETAWSRFPNRAGTRFIALLAVVLCCLLASKGLALLPGYMLDDYLHSDTFSGRQLAYLSQGRFTEAALATLSNALGLRWTEIYLFNLALSFVAYAWLIGRFVSALVPEGRAFAAQLLGGALIAVHPFFTELLAFRNADVNTLCFVGLLCLFLQAWLGIDARAALALQWRRQVVAAVALTLSIGAYQAALPLAGCVVMLIVFRRSLDGPASGFIARYAGQWRTLLPLVGATLLYALVNGAIRMLLPNATGDARGKIAGAQELAQRLPQVVDLLAELLYRGSSFQSAALSVTILLMLVFCVLRMRHLGPTAPCVAAAMFLGLLLACVLPLALAGQWWPVYRALPGVAFLVGGLVTLGLGAKERPPLALLLGVAVVVWGLAGQSNRILFDQWRLNRWDMNLAAQLLLDLEKSYGQVFPQAVSLVPPPVSIHQTPLLSAMKDHGVSGLQLTKYQSGLFREATGRSIRVVPPDTTAVLYCQASPRWPAAEAVTLRGEVIYVCL
ncbi:glucosyltransferase domain-containing protein [Pseudomonas sp. PDNC002]|uniref:glucosyltransferase domain-containing protein n=1 Tax=Pseudomonas sp. PDNC002 TaxID=2811422 RepID=UPI001965C4BA|nr:glucosyltransferase domain-containing protein [Pseudomonas sp. PDNC002]QRY80306.1 glucosyltransferase domain-containing protein [Pseudomonas sp. PDNC002]